MKEYSKEQYDEIFNENYGGLFKTYQQLEEVVFSFNSKDLCDEPLVKLKQDIYKQIQNEQGKAGI